MLVKYLPYYSFIPETAGVSRNSLVVTYSSSIFNNIRENEFYFDYQPESWRKFTTTTMGQYIRVQCLYMYQLTIGGVKHPQYSKSVWVYSRQIIIPTF